MSTKETTVRKEISRLTTEQIAKLLGCDAKTIFDSFLKNQKYFKLGYHYIIIDDYDSIEPNINNVFWTERSIGFFAKDIDTDEAWIIF